MAAYTNDLRLKEIGTGESSGTWGTETNTNLELIAEAFSFGTEAITTNADTHTSTIADGSTDEARSIFLKYTGNLDSDCTITIGPNTISKLWLIENATGDSGSSGPYNIIIKQGTGATVTIPNGQTKAIYSDGAGSGGAMVDAFTDVNVADSFTISGSTPTLTLGDAGAEDTKIVFDGNAQDFYIGLDDSADDLVIGLGSAVGTTPAIEIDENQDIKFAQSIGVGQAASSTTGDIVAQTMSLLGTTPSLTLGDGGEEDVKIQFNGVKDFYIANDDSADKLVIGEGSTVGTNPILTLTDDTVTLGDGAAVDTALIYDGNAKDFYIALDDSADKLVIGEGSTVGTNSILTIDDDSLTIGDGAEVDTKLFFDGNAVDFHLGIDDSADSLMIGTGTSLGSNIAIGVDSSRVIKFNNAYTFPTSDGSANQALTTNGSGALSFSTVSSSVDGTFQDIEVFTSSGTYTKPSGLKRVVVYVVGGGGAGRSGGGGGGAGGGTAIEVIEASSIGSTETVTIGAGGTDNTSNPAGSGGTSSFGSHCSATGGGGGALTAGGGHYPGDGGAGSGGDLNITGQGANVTHEAQGGSSAFGGGGRGSRNDGTYAHGQAGGAFGGGGGGAISGGNGGDGAAGVVFVFEYFDD
jgi:hypothetical protein